MPILLGLLFAAPAWAEKPPQIAVLPVQDATDWPEALHKSLADVALAALEQALGKDHQFLLLPVDADSGAVRRAADEGLLNPELLRRPLGVEQARLVASALRTSAAMLIQAEPAIVGQPGEAASLTYTFVPASGASAVKAELSTRVRAEELNTSGGFQATAEHLGKELAEKFIGECVKALSAPGRVPSSTAEEEFQRGLEALTAGDAATAVAHLEQAVQMDSSHPDYYVKFAEALQLTGQKARAAAELKRAAQLAPANPEIARRLGEALLDLERYEEALRVLREAYDANPAAPGLAAALTRAYTATGDPGSAAEILRRTLAAGSKEPNLYLELGNVYAQMGRTQDAEAAYLAAFQAAPDNPAVLETLIKYFMGQSRPDRALTYVVAWSQGWSESTELEPSQAQTLFRVIEGTLRRVHTQTYEALNHLYQEGAPREVAFTALDAARSDAEQVVTVLERLPGRPGVENLRGAWLNAANLASQALLDYCIAVDTDSPTYAQQGTQVFSLVIDAIETASQLGRRTEE